MASIIQLVIIMCQINGSGSYARHVDKTQSICQKYYYDCIFNRLPVVSTEDLNGLNLRAMDAHKRQWYYNRLVICTSQRRFK